MDRETLSSRGFGVELQFPERKWPSGAIEELFKGLRDRHSFNNLKFEGESKAVLVSDPVSQTEIHRVVIMPQAVGIHTGKFNDNREVFWSKAEDIIRSVYERLKIDIVLPQIYIARMVVNPKLVEDARVFIGDRVCGFTPEKRAILKASIHAVGISFFAISPAPDNPYHYNVRIESLKDDPRVIFLENKAVYFAPVPGYNPELIKERFLNTCDFLTNNLADFLEQFN